MDTGLGRHAAGMAAATSTSPSRPQVHSRPDMALRIGWSAYLALLVFQYLPEGREWLVDTVTGVLPGAAGDLVSMVLWLGLLPVFALFPFARRGQRRSVRHCGLVLVAVNAFTEALRNLTLTLPPPQWLSNLDAAASNAFVGLVAGALLFAGFRLAVKVRHHWARHRRG